MTLLDARYGDKRLAKLAARAMVDDDVLVELLENGNRLVHRHDSPGDVTIKFLANTADLVQVVPD